jgi:hypothetical protein
MDPRNQANSVYPAKLWSAFRDQLTAQGLTLMLDLSSSLSFQILPQVWSRP